MRGKPSLTPEDEAKLLRFDDLRYTLRDKNLAFAFNLPSADAVRHVLKRLRKKRREAAQAEIPQFRRTG